MPKQSVISNRFEKIDTDYQLVIVGGGIYGATLCWEATHRGIKTFLIEQEDYASGASSNSLKTIHGGLRSLQSFNIGAVIKGIRERSIFLKIAPNYVQPLTCVLPTTRSLMKSWPVVGMGLFLYNGLSQVYSLLSATARKVPRARLLSRSEFLRRVPHIESGRITGGALWHDAQVSNTERLVLQFIKMAVKHGAVALNHVIALKHDQSETNGRHGVLIRDQLSGSEKTITTSVIVDCTSAWNFIRNSQSVSDQDENLTFIKSVNIVINKKIFDNAVGANVQAVESESSRLYFFSPWRNCTMIGTWYSATAQYPEAGFSREKAVACIDEINKAFNQKLLDIDDICNVHIGFLPAIKHQHKDSFNIDRSLLSSYQLKDWSAKSGMRHVYSLRGTKYTLARHDANKVINVIAKAMKWKVASSQSAQLLIYQEASKPENIYSLSDEIVSRLLTNYGIGIEQIFNYIKEIPEAVEVIPGAEHHIRAEIYYVIFYEQALTLSDLLKRRLDVGDRAPPELMTANYCAEIMQQLLSWTDDIKQAQVAELYASYPEFLTNK